MNSQQQRTLAARTARAARGGAITPWPRRREQLRELFAARPRLSAVAVAAQLGVNRNSAGNALGAAMDEGLVHKVGAGMNTEYIWCGQ